MGRGTATYDGMALAQAIIEHIHDQVGAKTFFATHYHELTELSTSLTHLVNVHVATLEKDGDVTFLHKITAGPADKSYGVHVAKIAGLPKDLLQRATKILTDLESHSVSLTSQEEASGLDRTVKQETDNQQLSLFEVAEPNDKLAQALQNLDVVNMTPMEAMNALFELKKML